MVAASVNTSINQDGHLLLTEAVKDNRLEIITLQGPPRIIVGPSQSLDSPYVPSPYKT